MKHRNKKRMIIVLAALTVSVCVGMEIKQINTVYPQVKKVDVERTEVAELQSNVNMSIVKAELFSMKEAQLRYGTNFMKEIGEDYIYRTVEVTVLLENKTESMQDIALYDIYIEQEDYCNGLAPEVFFAIGNETDYITLKENEAREVTLGYIVYEKQFMNKEWNTMKIEDFYLARQRYQEKLRWKI